MVPLPPQEAKTSRFWGKKCAPHSVLFVTWQHKAIPIYPGHNHTSYIICTYIIHTLYIYTSYIIYSRFVFYWIYIRTCSYIYTSYANDLKLSIISIQAGSLAPSPSYLQSPLWGDTSQGQRGRGGISPWSVGLNTCANRRPPESTPMWTPQATKLIKL